MKGDSVRGEAFAKNIDLVVRGDHWVNTIGASHAFRRLSRELLYDGSKCWVLCAIFVLKTVGNRFQNGYGVVESGGGVKGHREYNHIALSLIRFVCKFDLHSNF